MTLNTSSFLKQTSHPGRAVGIAVFCLIVLVGACFLVLRYYPQAPDHNALRAAERAKAFAELTAQNDLVLTNYGWMDPTRGMVRLSLQRAMELTVEYWKDPKAGRSNLISRAERATGKPLENVNPFE